MAFLKSAFTKFGGVIGCTTMLVACGTGPDSTGLSSVIDEKCAKEVAINPSVSFSECRAIVEEVNNIGKIASGEFLVTDPEMDVAKAMSCAQDAYELYDGEGTPFELDRAVVKKYGFCLSH